MKKPLTLFLVVLLAASLCIPAMAADTAVVTLDLYCEGASLDGSVYNITVQPGETISVSYRQTASASAGVTAAQNEIQYDTQFFERVTDNKTVRDADTTTELMGQNYRRFVYFNTATDYALSTETTEIGTFTLKVKDTASGETTVSNTNVKILTATGKYETVAHDLHVSIGTAQEQTFKITLWDYNSEEITTLSHTAGGSVVLPEGPAREGYTFAGWSDGTTVYPAGAAYTAAADTVLTATYTLGSSGDSSDNSNDNSDANLSGGGVSGGGGGGGSSVTTPSDSPAADDTTTTTTTKDTVAANVLGCNLTTLCPAYPYTDVDTSKWYHAGIHYCVEMGYMDGTGENIFQPTITTSRAMIVTILYRMEGEPASPGTSSFQDVPAGKWYSEAVFWAAENGIVTGYSDTKFGPTDDITREQFATILYRYASYKGYDVTHQGDLSQFTDADKIGSWAEKAVIWANGAGLMTGRSDTLIVPKGDAMRAEAATLIYRFDTNIAATPSET